MRQIVCLAAPVLLFFAGCDETRPPPRSDSTAARKSLSPAPPSSANARSSAQSRSQAIPKDVVFTIVDKNIVPSFKRSLDVRLNRKVSEDVLYSIAIKLKTSDPKTYQRTFIAYYLPHMKVDSRAWATTHFNPDLEVRILGLTAEQENALKQQPDHRSREIIGSWLQEMGFANRITIFRKDGKLFMENKYKDGSAGITELVETSSPRGRRFDYKPDRGNGEYYLINTKGDLQEWDQDGPFLAAKKTR